MFPFAFLGKKSNNKLYKYMMYFSILVENNGYRIRHINKNNSLGLDIAVGNMYQQTANAITVTM
jgi:hypothetical protein